MPEKRLKIAKLCFLHETDYLREVPKFFLNFMKKLRGINPEIEKLGEKMTTLKNANF